MSTEIKSFIDLIKEKGFDPQEAIKHGKQVLNNANLYDDAYYAKFLSDKGINYYIDKIGSVVEKKGTGSGTFSTIQEMNVDDKVEADLVIISKMSEFSKIVCPKWHTLEEGTEFCEKCGKEVKPLEIKIPQYLGADSTGTIPVILTAWLHKESDLTGKTIRAVGSKQKNGKFNLTGIKKLGDNKTVSEVQKTVTVQPQEAPKVQAKTHFNDNSTEDAPATRLLQFIMRISKTKKVVDFSTLLTFYNAIVAKDTKVPFDVAWTKAQSATDLIKIEPAEKKEDIKVTWVGGEKTV